MQNFHKHKQSELTFNVIEMNEPAYETNYINEYQTLTVEFEGISEELYFLKLLKGFQTL